MTTSRKNLQTIEQQYLTEIIAFSRGAAYTIREITQGKNPDWKDQSAKQLFSDLTEAGVGQSYSGVPSLNPIDEFQILIEFAFFLLHLTDRIATECDVDIHRRNQILTTLERQCNAMLINTVARNTRQSDTEIRAFEVQLHNVYVDRMLQWGRYQNLLPEEGKRRDGTLFWEFGKLIAELSNREFDVRIIAATHEIVVKTLQDLDTRSFIREIR